MFGGQGGHFRVCIWERFNFQSELNVPLPSILIVKRAGGKKFYSLPKHMNAAHFEDYKQNIKVQKHI